MADLLGSILGSMEKPPSLGDEERKKARAQKKLLEKQQEEEKKKLAEFRVKIQKKIHEFVKDGNQQKYKFETMDKVYRAIVHEVADVAGLTSFSFGHEEEDRYVMLWKKEFAPTDEELLAYRRGEDWDPEKAKEIAKQKQEQILAAAAGSSKHKDVTPVGNYRDKYRHLIGDDVVTKDDAKETVANRSYGFVSADNKRDRRTIEQVLADTRAKKRMKTDIEASTQGEVTSFADQGAAESDETSP
ncbi:sperm-associated antigen 7 homolog isoform X2 [Pomacea canaliculata]|uniref:sperm-associated antigen 7 homolog isoform X2 n=1 Tax=Pomacea canaliculata TaxID=400727 RepID=UPI000D7316A0|nr:sperm-associated antigen 7 homolog isoform X2 [Pomacea canaliculata]